ncbi:MAG: hypothetical protein WCJ30_00510 [Deltaproteobacteria bacterium]
MIALTNAQIDCDGHGTSTSAQIVLAVAVGWTRPWFLGGSFAISRPTPPG